MGNKTPEKFSERVLCQQKCQWPQYDKAPIYMYKIENISSDINRGGLRKKKKFQKIRERKGDII